MEAFGGEEKRWKWDYRGERCVAMEEDEGQPANKEQALDAYEVNSLKDTTACYITPNEALHGYVAWVLGHVV
jgi:hypothetical protein